METPPTIIEDMTAHNRDVLVANAYQRYNDKNGQSNIRAYDFNSWIDSETALNLAAKMTEDDVLFEGCSLLNFFANHRLR